MTIQSKLTVAVSAVALFAVASAGFMYSRVRAFDAKHKCDVLAGLSAEELQKRSVSCAKKEAEADKTAASSQSSEEAKSSGGPLSVVRVDYDGDSDVSIVFSDRPDMDVVRNYIKISPLIDGIPSFRYGTHWNSKRHLDEPVIHVTGQYAYRTNITLRVLKGFPLYGKGANPQAEGSMTNDYVEILHRNDPRPNVSFGDSGRYLPPGGRRSVRVESIGVTNIHTSICRVEPRNIVQLLARDERVYQGRGWCSTADEGETAELSGSCKTGVIHCVNIPCTKESHLFSVDTKDAGRQRGVFLLSILSGDRPRVDYEWKGDEYNPCRYRLVCLSDLGLSVRDGQKNLGVWVTSLTTGKPVKDARVEIYSSANILIAEGDSDANGWCETQRVAEGVPFAVVVWTADDMTFMALRDSMKIDETPADGQRPGYLTGADVDAFAWTERGIYRHGERIFIHTIVRDRQNKAPAPMPIRLVLKDPEGTDFLSKTMMTDANGSFVFTGFAVPAERPSGMWTLEVRLPGKEGALLASGEIKIEEFAPPQIRVNVRAEESQHPSNFAFTVSAEHLFGGPARALACEGAVVFEDVPFAPKGWKGFTFGNEDLGLKPSFRRLSGSVLDETGVCAFKAPLFADSGRPKAAVRATGQGVVFEDGGRPATARKSIVCHYYPYYLGSTLPSWLRLSPTSAPRIDFVCVDTQGRLLPKARKLVGKIDRIDSVYSYRQNDEGVNTWDCDRIRTTVFDKITISVNEKGRAEYELPIRACGDYALTVEDPETGVSFGRTFYLSDWGDDVVRAPLSNPTEVTLRTDKSFYRVGDRPRLIVKSPFAGYAVLSVMRDDRVYDEILNLTNATSEVVLRPVERAWAPNVDVSVSVVQSVSANAKHLAARAHGRTTVKVRPIENEIDVRLDATVKMNAGKEGSRVEVDVSAPRATSAVVTVVDEGINLLTDEAVPDPVGYLSMPRDGALALYDIFNKILPVVDGTLKASGIKTGGGFGAEMLGRVSPVPTRRFKPLALWKANVALVNGKGHVSFDLSEFIGEVRVTAVAYSAVATGATSVQKKVTPKLVMQPDAPRFAAPGDAFDATLTLRNGSGKAGNVHCEVQVLGGDASSRPDGVLSADLNLRAGESTNVVIRMKAPSMPGELAVKFRSSGFGETHEATIPLPVRPAVAWREEAGVACLNPGTDIEFSAQGEKAKFGLLLSGTPVAELVSALDWLAEYPHGCLEQTASRIFPLIAAGGILNSVAPKAAANRAEFVAAGVRRVESMIRENDFVMWPDSSYAPWDHEVSLYAAHFLVEAEKSGARLAPRAKTQVMKFLKKWAMSTNVVESAYACHTLALAGAAEKDRMLRLYDKREKMDALSRARLARAFVVLHDQARADALMAYAFEPQSIREAAFTVLALVDLNPNDARIPKLVAYLTSHRDRKRFTWGTTAENAHALLAIGAYFQHQAIGGRGDPFVTFAANGREESLSNRTSRVFWAKSVRAKNEGAVPAFLSWRRMELPDASSVADESRGISIRRAYWRPNGTPADLANLVRGEMLLVELTITSDVPRVIGDLVIEDLFAGAFEPVYRELAPGAIPATSEREQVKDWILRTDARDDRMLVYSKKFELRKDNEAKVLYPVRVVSAGDFILPGPSVEGMYNPDLHSRRAPGRLVVRH